MFFSLHLPISWIPLQLCRSRIIPNKVSSFGANFQGFTEIPIIENLSNKILCKANQQAIVVTSLLWEKEHTQEEEVTKLEVS